MKNTGFLLLLMISLAAATLNAQTAVQCLVGGVWVPCSMAPQPQFVQAPVAKSSTTGSVTSLSALYGTNPTKGNTLIVVVGNGNSSALTINDSLTLQWFKAAQIANGTAFQSSVYYAVNTHSGSASETVTVSQVTSSSMAMTIYEVAGLIYPSAASSPVGPQALDQAASNTSSANVSSPAVNFGPLVPNEYVFAGFALGTAAQTISVVSPYNNDSGQLNPTSPSGLFSFVSASYFKPDMASGSPSASVPTAEPWAVAVASFKTLTVPVQGTIQGLGAAGTPVGGVVSVQGVTSGTAISVNSAQLAGATLGSPSTYGTAPTGTVAGVNAYVTNNVTLNTGTNTIGKVDVLGSTGVAFDGSLTASGGPTNGIAVIGQFNSTAPAPTNGQTVGIQLAPNGNLIDQPYRRSQIVTKTLTLAGTGSTPLLAAGGSGVYTDITSLIITTTSGGASAPFTATISDGTNSYVFDLNPDQAEGAGTISISFNPPLAATSANVGWTQQNNTSTQTHTTVVAVKQGSF